MFEAIWLTKTEQGTHAEVKAIDESALDEGDTTVNVEWSSLNFKDALAVTGRSPVVRRFPMIPGIDFAGTVAASSGTLWTPGDKVLLTGWGHGETVHGGWAERARVDGARLVRVPAGLDARSVMAIGTAGFTAMLAVEALQRHGVAPAHGEVLVTGAGGGVGGFAIAILARRGFQVVAVTGRPSEEARLRRLGASEVLARDLFSQPGKPLGKERWAGAVDSVGSHTLANVCAGMRYGGAVAACGLAQGMDFPATVAPFILRGVALLGIDSVYAPAAERAAVWQHLARDLSAEQIGDLVSEVALDQAIPHAQALLEGRISGRVVVRVSSP